jgi:CO/xanthine dehydrogenase FAD-binding subunit
VQANSDLNASAAYRSQMARIFTARALTVALARAS